MLAGGGCLAVLCGLFVLGVIATRLTPELQRTEDASGVEHAEHQNKITSDFFPFELDAKRHFSRLVYLGDAEVQSRIEHEFSGNNVIFEKTVSQFIPRGGNLPSGDDTDSIRFRINGQLIETGRSSEYSNGIVWSPILKIGASTADTWERRYQNGVVQSYQVVGFESRKINENIKGGGSVECVVVEMRMTAPVGPETIVESVYAKGVGRIREDAWIVENGQRTMTRSCLLYTNTHPTNQKI